MPTRYILPFGRKGCFNIESKKKSPIFGWMKWLFRHLHLTWLIFTLILFYGMFFPFFWIFSRNPKNYHLLNKSRTLCSTIILTLSGIFVRIKFEKPLDPNAVYVFCPNHSSNLDTPLMCMVAQKKYHFMGKSELLEHPFFKLFFKSVDIPVNRNSKRSAYAAFRRCVQNLQSDLSLILFPEGTFSPNPPQLLSFKSGAFRMAIEAGVPVVPVSIVDSWKILADSGLRSGSRPGIIRIFVHQPIKVGDMSVTDDDKLMELTRSIIENKLTQNADRQKHSG